MPQLPLLSGRTITAHETRNTTPVVIISRTAAGQFFTIRPRSAAAFASTPSAPSPHRCRCRKRSAGPTSPTRRALRAVEPDQPITLRVAGREAYDDLKGSRVVVTLFSIFAALALFLAAIGLWSVSTQSARERTHEVGVRLALGATPSSVTRLMMSESARLTAIGVAIGSLALLGIGFSLGPMLLQPVGDPITFTVSTVILSAIAALASILPVRSAARADVARVLRTD